MAFGSRPAGSRRRPQKFPGELFLQQATVSCEAGASGVMAGRAVWDQAVTLDRHARRDWLETVARERIQRLAALADALGRPLAGFPESD